MLLLRYTPIEGSSEGTGSPTNNHLHIKKPPPLNPCVENNMSCAREVPSESLIISKKLFFKPTLRPRRREERVACQARIAAIDKASMSEVLSKLSQKATIQI